MTVDGKFVGYVSGASAIVNASFLAQFPTGFVVNTPVVISRPKQATASPPPATTAPPPATSGSAETTWTVRSGDSLILIAVATGVPWEQIAAANGPTSLGYPIQIGHVLKIPASS